MGLPSWWDKALFPLFILVAALFPFFFDSGGTMMGTAVLALAYVVMALGLNIIVGFAGLLDLGFVAFFAIGAYTMGWFGSLFFAEINGEKGDPHPRGRPGGEAAGHPHELLADPHRGGHRDHDRRHAHRPADAAPARRLHRDRDARVRRDHRPRRRSTATT